MSCPRPVFCILLRCAGQQHGGLRIAWGSHLTDSFPLPPHLSLPFTPPLPLPAVQKCLLILIDMSRLCEFCHNWSQIAFTILSSFSVMNLMWEDAVKMCWFEFCCCRPTSALIAFIFGFFIWYLSVFYPQIPIISADHLSSHKYLTQM